METGLEAEPLPDRLLGLRSTIRECERHRIVLLASRLRRQCSLPKPSHLTSAPRLHSDVSYAGSRCSPLNWVMRQTCWDAEQTASRDQKTGQTAVECDRRCAVSGEDSYSQRVLGIPSET